MVWEFKGVQRSSFWEGEGFLKKGLSGLCRVSEKALDGIYRLFRTRVRALGIEFRP